MRGVWAKVLVTVVLVILPEWVWLTQPARADLEPTSPNEGAPLSGWAVAVAAGNNHTCALTMGGGVKCWGDNQSGQLGDGTTQQRLTPVDVMGLRSGVQAIAAGGYHTCALMSAGGVKCWGANWHGQLGDGTTIDRLAPVDVQGFEEAGLVLAAGGHTCVAPARGGIKCWGRNFSGQLGDGTTTARLSAVEVVGFAGQARQLRAGLNHTCAVDEQGDLLCWGSNFYGQLGDGTWTDCLTPTGVLGWADGAQAISGGQYHTCAVTSGGAAKCWGYNSDGQIGNGSEYSLYNSPVEVAGLQASVVSIASGGDQSCAIMQDGSMRCWGNNDKGQLGDGRYQDRLVPVDVSGLQDRIADASLSSYHTCAVTNAGAVKCWGWNAHGELGDGSTTNRLTPVDVLVYNCAGVSEIPESECQALVRLRLSTIAPGWSWRNATGWLQNTTPCSWQGVTCAAGHVTGLNLANNDMGGSLPPELGDLVALRDLDLSGNALRGNLPAEIGGLSALETLNLSRNRFTGPLPPEWGSLTALRVLDLSQSGARGQLPAAWGGLKTLQHLRLYDVGGLSGPLPAELGQLTALRTLDLSANGFDALPDTVGQLHSLESLHLNNNYFSGPLPATLGNLPALRFLSVYSNRFSGPIPPALGQLRALQSLNLSRNALSGPIPPELGHLTAAQGIDLSENQLTGPLPETLSGLTSVQVLNLSYNELTGELPAGLGTLPLLTNLYLNDNRLSGAIPPELGGLPALQAPSGAQRIAKPPEPPCCGYIALSSNRLSGPIPSELKRLSGVRSLDLAGNQLAGPLPAGLGELADYWHNFGHNMLDAPADPAIAATQTVPPAQVQVVCATEAMTLTWTPIPYTADAGYYEISFGPGPNGPWTTAGVTSDKTVDHYVIVGSAIDPGVYFRVRTFTPAHAFEIDDGWGGHYYNQQNDLWSAYSAPVRCSPISPLDDKIWLTLIWG